MEGVQAMSAYCQAQARIDRIGKAAEEEQKQLTQEVRTYRSLLQDEMTAHGLTCIEVQTNGDDDAVFVRLKAVLGTVSHIDAEVVMDVLRTIDAADLASHAQKNGSDLPRMLSSLLTDRLQQTSRSKRGERTSLIITTTKERDFSCNVTANVPERIVQIGKDLLRSRDSLVSLKRRCSEAKRPVVEEQKLVEESVKYSLKQADPVNMSKRVHMTETEHAGEGVFYLRCKEKHTAPTVGIRKIGPLVETSVADCLQSHGFNRQYDAAFRPSEAFWESVRQILAAGIGAIESGGKTTSRITLDRGAPRSSKRIGPERAR